LAQVKGGGLHFELEIGAGLTIGLSLASAINVSITAQCCRENNQKDKGMILFSNHKPSEQEKISCLRQL
jgi:hypothetical protein